MKGRLDLSRDVLEKTDTEPAHLESVHYRLLRRIVAETPEEHLTRE